MSEPLEITSLCHVPLLRMVVTNIFLCNTEGDLVGRRATRFLEAFFFGGNQVGRRATSFSGVDFVESV
jgi:hypothetical protein